jgi:hypothetical protein
MLKSIPLAYGLMKTCMWRRLFFVMNISLLEVSMRFLVTKIVCIYEDEVDHVEAILWSVLRYRRCLNCFGV